MYKSIRNNLGDYILSAFFLPLDIIINIFPRFYEKFLCFILRANEITFLLEKMRYAICSEFAYPYSKGGVEKRYFDLANSLIKKIIQ